MACSLQLKNQHLHRAGIRELPLFIVMFCSHGRLFKRAFSQDRAVKRVYMVFKYRQRLSGERLRTDHCLIEETNCTMCTFQFKLKLKSYMHACWT